MESQSRPGLLRKLDVTVDEPPERFSFLAGVAIASQVILFATAWFLPVVSEFSLTADNISELVLGRYGFMQTSAFLLAGLGTVGLAFSIRSLTAGAGGSSIGSLLIGIYGAGALLVALFPTDRIDTQADVWAQSTIGTIHVITALVSFLCAVIGMFVLTRTFSRHPQWRSLTPWSVLFPTVALALILVQQQGPLVGLLQRLLVGVISAWLILAAFRVRSIVATGQSRTST